MIRSRQDRFKFWQRHVEAAKLFPGSVQQYCDKHEIQSTSFYQWRKRLSEPGPSSESGGFLPVVISSVSEEVEHPPFALPDAKWVAEVMLRLIRGLA